MVTSTMMANRIIAARTVVDNASCILRIASLTRTWSGGRLIARENLPAWHLPCRRRQHPVAHGLHGGSHPCGSRALVYTAAGPPGDVLIRRVEAEADEMHGFVQDKANEHWLWLAMDRATHQIIALHVGDRRLKSARQLWVNLPAVYREQATFSTNQSAVYRDAFQRRGTQRSRRKPGKPLTLSAAITPCASASPDWCVRHRRSPRTERITPVRSATSSAMTT